MNLYLGNQRDLLSGPWVFLRPDRVGRGCGLELLEVEAGGVPVDHCERYMPGNGGLKVNWERERRKETDKAFRTALTG
jgi:hypothetical protein